MKQPNLTDRFNSTNNQTTWWAALIVFTVFAIYFFIVVNSGVKTDIQEHALMAHSFAVNHDNLTPNFLYYFLVALLSGFSEPNQVYYLSSIVLTSAAVSAKFLANHFYINRYANLQKHQVISWALSFAMLFVFALPSSDFVHSKYFYLGQLTPNIWHNSTSIFVMPFAMLLFFKSYELLFENDTYQNKNLLIHIALLITINALVKPSFLFTLLPSVLVFFCYNKLSSNNSNKLSQLSPYLFGIIFIAIEYYVIFKLNHVSSVAAKVSQDYGKASIVLAPFEVWRHFSDNIFIATISSLFFPMLYIFVSKGHPLKNKIIQFALINFIVGLSIWILFAEDGARKFHANFLWQVVITTYLLFFSLLLNFINDVKSNALSHKKQLIIGGAFSLHFLWGIVYWLKIIFLKSYF